jgi:hypothetical protein
MKIEVAVSTTATSKEKGELLEKLASDLTERQSYSVTEQVRLTACELDLLCKHKVSSRKLYVECKAYRETLGASVLRQLLGTIGFSRYDEGWLISAGPLGKDAKGFVEEWENRTDDLRKSLSIYTPDRIIEALIDSKTIVPKPETSALNYIGGNLDLVGEWILLITTYGRFWTLTVLESGVATGVLVFSANTGAQIQDPTLLRKLAGTDSSLRELNFEYDLCPKPTARRTENSESSRNTVVEVQHGESWSDYRPARPEHFVGRRGAQNDLIRFLENVRKKTTKTRVFAITGDSGMGKSSLVAKLRDRVRNVRYRNKYFVYAVDVRAATNANYIAYSLICCLRAAIDEQVIEDDGQPIRITNHSDPIASDSIQHLLDRLESSGRVVALVFDQFEELYSKPELFSVFEEAQRLFLSAISCCSNLVLGFAWKTDSTVQQGHPAYFMWHRLSDHRYEVGLHPFVYADASKAITVFEKELGHELKPDLRRQIIENSQGYPWLLKKLCIHLYEQIQTGTTQSELAETLDIGSLFDQDLNSLTQPERQCLELIAYSAPSDWYEVLELFDRDVIAALQDKRMIIRSGDRLNVYWDIFREYVLTGKPPAIPFTYIPSSPSIKSLLAVSEKLEHDSIATAASLCESIDLTEKTIGNVIHDLFMLGVAAGSYDAIRLDSQMSDNSNRAVLERIRSVMKRHALTRYLKSEFDENAVIDHSELKTGLMTINPAASHSTRTWDLYAGRMGRWLSTTGILTPVSDGWQRIDVGDVVFTEATSRRGFRRQFGPFLADAPPARVVEALKWLHLNQPSTLEMAKENGLRNAVTVLTRFGIARSIGDLIETDFEPDADLSFDKLIWQCARDEETLAYACDFLNEKPHASGVQLGAFVSDCYKTNWSDGTKLRAGNALKIWATWILAGQFRDSVPPAPGRRSSPKSENGLNQLSFFEDEMD